MAYLTRKLVMSDIANIDIEIHVGYSFSDVLRWTQPQWEYKAITVVTQAAPCVLTVTAHGLPDGWPFKVENVLGMTDLNSVDSNCEWYEATVIDANHIEINSIDSTGFLPYQSGSGVVKYHPPVDMSGYTAIQQIRSDVDSSVVLLEMSTSNGRISIDNTAKTITRSISAADTASITFTTGGYDLKMIPASGANVPIAEGSVIVDKVFTQ